MKTAQGGSQSENSSRRFTGVKTVPHGSQECKQLPTVIHRSGMSPQFTGVEIAVLWTVVEAVVRCGAASKAGDQM